MKGAALLIVCASLLSGCGCDSGDDACIARHQATAQFLSGLSDGLGKASAAHQQTMDSIRQSDEDFQNYRGLTVPSSPPAPDYPTFSSSPTTQMGDPVPDRPGWVYEPNGPVPSSAARSSELRQHFRRTARKLWELEGRIMHTERDVRRILVSKGFERATDSVAGETLTNLTERKLFAGQSFFDSPNPVLWVEKLLNETVPQNEFWVCSYYRMDEISRDRLVSKLGLACWTVVEKAVRCETEPPAAKRIRL